jgi:23S rRNA G2445 N2-methylase RlmL
MEDIHREGAKSAKETDKKENLASFAALRENALLSLKVCDPACGSGHFLIAAAHASPESWHRYAPAVMNPPPTKPAGRCVM